MIKQEFFWRLIMSAVFRVEKNKGYTVMSNYHLKDKRLSLKAKGLLSQMLSLPGTWDYTLRGLAHINKESLEAVRTAVKELENNGYITRKQGRDSKGKMGVIEYTIYEQPLQESPCCDNPNTDYPRLEEPCSENPNTDEPNTDYPTSENRTQLNTNITNTKKLNNDISNIHQSIPKTPERLIDEMDTYRNIIHGNIEYDILVQRYGESRVDEIVELMLDVICSPHETVRICGQDFPREIVKSRLLKLTSQHIDYVFECLNNNSTKIHNISAYLLTALYKAPTTIDSYYRAEVKHDFYGGAD